MKRITGAIALLVIICAGKIVSAHTLPISHMRIVPDEDQVHLELTLNPFELQFISEIDGNGDDHLTAQELEGKRRAVTDRLLDCIELTVGGSVILPESSGIQTDITSHHLTLRVHYPVDARQSVLALDAQLAAITSRSHISKVTYTFDGYEQKARLTAGGTRAVFKPQSSGARTSDFRESTVGSGGLSLLGWSVAVLFGFSCLAVSFFVLKHNSGSEL